MRRRKYVTERLGQRDALYWEQRKRITTRAAEFAGHGRVRVRIMPEEAAELTAAMDRQVRVAQANPDVAQVFETMHRVLMSCVQTPEDNVFRPATEADMRSFWSGVEQVNWLIEVRADLIRQAFIYRSVSIMQRHAREKEAWKQQQSAEENETRRSSPSASTTSG